MQALPFSKDSQADNREEQQMSDLKFEEFEKLERMKRNCTITEKVDGTNSQILFGADGEILVGSRKREIWPEGWLDKPKGCDNFSFAKWAHDNHKALFEFLGEGRHFGEWCGGKIRRGYGLREKKFLLFNSGRFGEGKQVIPDELKEAGLGVVPVLFEGEFTTDTVDRVMVELKESGSKFVEGFMNPEGVVVYHHALRKSFKVTYEHDKTGKGLNRQSPS
jgi:hypothetical protein